MANSLDAYFPEIWAGESLRVLQNNMVFGMIVHRDFENVVARFGDTVNTRKPAAFTAATKTAAVAVTLQDAQATNVQVVLNNHKIVPFNIEDVEATKSFDDLSEEFMMPAGIALAQAIDAAIGDENANFTTEYNVGDVMSKTALIGARRRALDAQIPLDGRVHLVLSTIAEEYLLNETQFTDADRVGDDGTALREASLGRKYGLNLWVDQNINTSGGVDSNMLFHRNGLALVSRPLAMSNPNNPGVSTAVMQNNGFGLRALIGYDLNNVGTRVHLDVLYGIKTLDTALCLEVNTNQS